MTGGKFRLYWRPCTTCSIITPFLCTNPNILPLTAFSSPWCPDTMGMERRSRITWYNVCEGITHFTKSLVSLWFSVPQPTFLPKFADNHFWCSSNQPQHWLTMHWSCVNLCLHCPTSVFSANVNLAHPSGTALRMGRFFVLTSWTSPRSGILKALICTLDWILFCRMEG